MSWLTLKQIATWLEADLVGSDADVSSVFTDTRKPRSDGLFFALQGPNFDAHAILESATLDIATVAAGLVVARPVDHPAPQIIVKDTLQALQQLASSWRQKLDCPIVALTGSNGKTTVKEMIASIASEVGSVLATQGNLNNEIGVPLSLLQIRQQHDFAIIEMGASKPGDIRLLSQITKPDIALITNAGSAHLEGFGDVETVATTKGEIFEGLTDQGIAIINLDDHYSDYWQWLVRDKSSITFGFDSAAAVQVVSKSPLVLGLMGKEHEVDLAVRGKHNISNAAAAAAVGIALGIDEEKIVSGLGKMRAVKGRLMALTGPFGSLLIDDTYNANPVSVMAAVDVIADEAGNKILVLGDMAELGDVSDRLHEDIGHYAKERNIDTLFTLGSSSRLCAEAFGDSSKHFTDLESLCAALLALIDKDTVVLVKGSRSMQMERVIDWLQSQSANPVDQQEQNNVA